MTLITIITIGLLAALAARSIFPGSDFLGSRGLLSQSMVGACLGACVAVFTHGHGARFAFMPIDIWWSTLGSTVVIASVSVVRRAHFAQLRHRAGPPDIE